MTHLRRTVLAAFAVALCAAPIAAAGDSQKHGRDAVVVVPVHKVAGTPVGEFLGEGFVEDYEAHAGDPPADPCFIVEQKGKTALVMGPNG
jgi:hypothetical protein